MGGRGSSSATSKASDKKPDFTINVHAYFQKIETGMTPEEALKRAEEQIMELDYEMSVLITKDGNIYATRGRENRVKPAYGEVTDDGYNTDEVISLHNHPVSRTRTFGGTSSDSDWNLMLMNNQTVSYITAKEGRYTLRITDPSKIERARAFFSTTKKGGYWFEHKNSNYRINSRKEFNNGNYENSVDGFLKASMATLRKFGTRYGFECEFQPNSGWENLYD